MIDGIIMISQKYLIVNSPEIIFYIDPIVKRMVLCYNNRMEEI